MSNAAGAQQGGEVFLRPLFSPPDSPLAPLLCRQRTAGRPLWPSGEPHAATPSSAPPLFLPPAGPYSSCVRTPDRATSWPAYCALSRPAHWPDKRPHHLLAPFPSPTLATSSASSTSLHVSACVYNSIWLRLAPSGCVWSACIPSANTPRPQCGRGCPTAMPKRKALAGSRRLPASVLTSAAAFCVDRRFFLAAACHCRERGHGTAFMNLQIVTCAPLCHVA